MFIAHLPAGYLITKAIQKLHHNNQKLFLYLGLFASIFPDFDLLYFYLINHRQTPHHDYMTHLPFFWGILYLCSEMVGKFLKNKNLILGNRIFFFNIFTHLFLDTVASEIRWLYPFSFQKINFFLVKSSYENWFLNFILHPTFLLELLICFLALRLLLRKSL